MSYTTTLPHVLQAEGGYVYNIHDSGGETFRGVSRVNNPGWPGWPLIDAAKKQVGATAAAINKFFQGDAEMYALVADIYRSSYYNAVARFTTRERPIDKMFDTAVNIGVKWAIKLAQRIVDTPADGLIGPNTQAAATIYFAQPNGENKFLAVYCAAQLGYYLDLVKKKPNQARFLDGWKARAAWRPE